MTMSAASIPTSLSPRWNDQGLIPAIAQDPVSGEVSMLAWMNAKALEQSLVSGQAIYWSRSPQALWRKGETFRNTQDIADIRLDCEGDTLLLRVHQHGAGTCHTGRRTCFFCGCDDGSW